MNSRRPAYRPPVEPLPWIDRIVLGFIALVIFILTAGLIVSAIACFTNPY